MQLRIEVMPTGARSAPKSSRRRWAGPRERADHPWISLSRRGLRGAGHGRRRQLEPAAEDAARGRHPVAAAHAVVRVNRHDERGLPGLFRRVPPAADRAEAPGAPISSCPCRGSIVPAASDRREDALNALPGVRCAGEPDAEAGVGGRRHGRAETRCRRRWTAPDTRRIRTRFRPSRRAARPAGPGPVDAAGRGGFATMNVMLLSVSVWSGGRPHARLFHLISAAIALPVVIISGQPFFRNAWTGLRAATLNMDVPISLAILLAAGISLFETLNGGEHAYFDAALALTFFLLIGRYLDHRSRAAARSAAAELSALEVRTAHRVEGDAVRVVRTVRACMRRRDRHSHRRARARRWPRARRHGADRSVLPDRRERRGAFRRRATPYRRAR